MKKIIVAKKKLIKRLNKAHKKTWSKNQFISMRKLVLSNSRTAKLDIFRDILSNLITAFSKLDKNSILFDQLFNNGLVSD